jgi:hypothetical protein
MVKLRPEAKELILDLLDTVPQCRDYLRRGECMCIEGVLCDAYHQLTGEGEWQGDAFICGDMRHATYLPPAAYEWLFDNPNLNWFDVKLIHDDVVHSAQFWNDKGGIDFPTFQQLIKEQW